MRGKRQRQENRKKRLMRWALLAVAVIVLLWIGLGLVVKSIITRDFLIKEAEESFTSQVDIKAVNVSLFSFPARITLQNVSLEPVEGKASDAAVLIERVDLRVSMLDLLFRELNVQSILISGADITTSYREDGTTSVEELFDKPGEEKSASDGSGSDDKGGGFNALEQEDFVTRLGELKIEGSRARVLLEEMGVQLLCTNLNIHLDEIRVDPAQLQNTNTAKLSISADVRADSVKGWQYGELFLSGNASAVIFNPETGETEPNIEGDISITGDSWLNTRVPVITKAWSFLGVLEKVGIKVAELPEKATFGRSEAIAAHYHRGKLTVRKPLSVWVGDWELAALDRSWLHTGTDQHEVRAELLASERASERFFSLIEKGAGLIPREVRPRVLGDIRDRLYRDDRLVVELQSTGDFSDPKVRAAGALPDLIESGKEAGKELLKKKARGLLDDLLNRDDD